jgi:hypothetical protein
LDDPTVWVAAGNAHLLEAARFCHEHAAGALPADMGSMLGLAERHYRTALAQDEDNPEAHYNLAVLLERMGRGVAARNHFDRYMGSTGGVVPNSFRKQTRLLPYTGCSSDQSSMVGALAWGRLHDGTIARINRGAREDPFPSRGIPFQELFLGQIGIIAASLFALFFAVIFWFQGAVARIRLTTRNCTSCGAAFCNACGTSSPKSFSCSRCVMEMLHVSLTDPKDVWLQKAKKTRSVRMRARVALVLGLLIPGFGHLIGTRPLRGLILMVLSLSCLAMFLGPLGFLPAWPSAWGLGNPTVFLGPGLLLFCFYAFGVPNAFQARRDIIG